MKKTGAQLILEVLLEHGVDTVFGYPGGAALNVYDALYEYQDRIKHILTAHEQGASHAADGYARATGKTGVVFATSGPGATNLVTGIATAYMDSVPMVAITSNVTNNLIGRDAFQEVYITGITMPITKHNFFVNRIEDLANALRQAFRIAQSGRKGPVLVDVTKDVTAALVDYVPERPLPLKEMPKATDEELQEVADAINKSLSDMTQVLTTCSQAITNMQEMYTTSLVPQLDNVIDSMSQMLNNVSDILTRLDDTLGDMNSVFSSIETTVTGANDSLEQIQTVIDGVSEKLTKLLNRLNSVEDDEKVQAFMEFMKGDPEGYGEFFSQPVLVTTEEVYPIPNYGSAMTPFYTILAIWVGGTILVALIKVKAEPKNLKNVKSYQLFFGRYLLFFVMGQLQALIIVLGDIYILHCQILYPGWFWLVASLASVTFTLLIYSLALSFGDVGKALAVVIMVIQIAGSGGTFPIELLPAVYRNIYIFFPFPYAINAMRETIGGMYGSDYMKNLAELMIFAVVGLLIGLVIRIPFVKLNHFVEKRMEDTKMM